MDPVPEELVTMSEDMSELKDLKWLLKIMEMRTNMMVQKSGGKIQELIAELGAYNAWNKMVPMHLKEMSIFYGHQWTFSEMIKWINSTDNENNKNFLTYNALVFAYQVFKDYPIALSGIFNREIWDKINDNLQSLYAQLIPDMLIFLDIMTPPDYLLKSNIGSSDGNVYDRVVQSGFSEQRNFGRVSYWRDVLKWREGRGLNYRAGQGPEK
jgi:hypothetical protein